MNKFKITNHINLASPILGTKIYKFSDQFFGMASRLIKDEKPIFKDEVYDSHGKWMDGWETRRKREKGNDYLIIKLGIPGKISEVVIDTAFFNGNQPEFASIDVCFSTNSKFKWQNLLKKKKLDPSSFHKFKIGSNKIINFVRLNIFPDGGVARLKLLGDLEVRHKISTKKIDLASVLNGAKIVACSDEHFGVAQNIISPGKSINMGNGWETKRRRGKGFDWVIIKLANIGIVNDMVIQTHHFKGNYPASFSLQGSLILNNSDIKKLIKNSTNWKSLVSKKKLKPHDNLKISKMNLKSEKINYVKLNIFPDGGISRLRIFGKIT
ncbi:allantoicase [Alphaproteobacteria bacterium]|nr:allantoicase [Alphaproteobacteria bacterium]